MGNTLLQQIGQVIRKIRKDKGLSIEDTAGKANIHSTYLAQIERGQRNLSIKALSQIAAALDVKVNSLLPDNPVRNLKDSYIDRYINFTDDLDNHHKDIVLSVVKELAYRLRQKS